MTDEGLGGWAASEGEVPVIDTSVPHMARMYDYALGGKDNFEVDRIAAEAAIKVFPQLPESARASRAFLRRVVRYLTAEAGIRQFLDVGTGLPSGQNVHQVAQSVAPDARIVYVDNDPIVLRHAQALLTGTPEGTVTFLHADLRAPERILAEAAKTLDFGQPMAVLLLGILHSIGDSDDPAGIVSELVQALGSGSYLSICHLTADEHPEMAAVARTVNEQNLNDPVTLRDHAQVTSFFDGLELVPPGVVQLSKWRPDSEEESQAAAVLWGGLARKP